MIDWENVIKIRRTGGNSGDFQTNWEGWNLWMWIKISYTSSAINWWLENLGITYPFTFMEANLSWYNTLLLQKLTSLFILILASYKHLKTGPEGCYIAGNFEAWNSLNLAVTAGYHLSTFVGIKHCTATLWYHRFCNVACSEILVGNSFIVRCHVTLK